AIADALRAAWPDVLILVRGDTGLAVPEVYEFCEAEGLLYAFGDASNEVLKDRTAPALADLETYYAFYQHREPEVQRFEGLEDYQAARWGVGGGGGGWWPRAKSTGMAATAASWSRICRAGDKESTRVFMCGGATCRSDRSAN